MKKYFLFVCLTFVLTAQAQNDSLIYWAHQAYNNADYEKAYSLFVECDSIEPVTYYYDLWKYYVASEKNNDSVRAKSLLYQLAESSGFDRKSLNQSFFEDIGLRQRSYWPEVDSLINVIESQRCQLFIDSLILMGQADQDIRKKLREFGWTADISKQMDYIDSTNEVKLQALMGKYGFPSWKLVGREGAKYAWLIAQHSKLLLPKYLIGYRQAVINNDADRSDLAYMEDRNLMIQGRPQIYGSQLNRFGPGTGYYPIIDMQNLDKRRWMMRLPPYSQYASAIGVDTLLINPNFLDYLTNYYPNNTNMYRIIGNHWQNKSVEDSTVFYWDQWYYDFPRDLEALALYLFEGDTLSAIQQSKKMVLCGKRLDEKWKLPQLLMDSVKANYDELRADYERMVTKDGDEMLNAITSFDTLVKVLSEGFYPRYTFDAWNGHLKDLISQKAATLTKNDYKTFFTWLFEQVKLGNYHLFDYAELYDEVYYRLYGKSYYGQKDFNTKLYKPQEVDKRRSTIQLPPLEVWQVIMERMK